LRKGKPSCGHQILQKGIKSSGSGEQCHAVAIFTDAVTSAGFIFHAISHLEGRKKETKEERKTCFKQGKNYMNRLGYSIKRSVCGYKFSCMDVNCLTHSLY